MSFSCHAVRVEQSGGRHTSRLHKPPTMINLPARVHPELERLARRTIEQSRCHETICGLEGRDGTLRLRRVGMGKEHQPSARDLHLSGERRQEEGEGEGERDAATS